MNRLRGNLTYANVMSTIAVILAIAGGTTAIAGSNKAPKNSVTSKSIKNGSVTVDDLAKITTVMGFGGPEAFAECPTGTRVLSGGGNGSLGLAASQPTRAQELANGWGVATGGSPSASTTAFALCLSNKPTK